MMNIDVIYELSWRGLINQTTDDENLPKLLLEKPRTVYAGFDPTADKDAKWVGSLIGRILPSMPSVFHRAVQPSL